MPREKKSHNNKGFAYVDFATDKAAKEARLLCDHILSGRRVLIKDAKDFEGRPPAHEEEDPPSSKRIFIGNLGFDVTKDDLEEQLGKCGRIKHAHVATFQDSGKCRGYAWVEFEDLAAAQAAVRGFAMVDDDGDNDDDDHHHHHHNESDESSKGEDQNIKQKRRRRRRRVWVNRLAGRQMRMEFAEDATTRYKKRFGKKRDEEEVQRKDNLGRYDEATVQKLSGAIVEAQGKKITFE